MSSGSKKRKRLPGAGEVRYAGQRRRSRTGLMATTALQAGAVLLLAFPVRAQPAPNARPQGGTVVGGQASIAQSTAQTTVAQSSQRAAIDWRSYDVGQAHTVTYQQPNASSITLNRVTGPDPSQIAGRIQANGQVAIVNQSGVVFMKGSQVDVQSLVVSSANISNANFMAGRMVFDQPGRPDAKISNAGTITVKATGLAALVAPQVQNSGVINAKLGHVVLAGAEAHTVDLYGDGLMSVDVTRQVQKAADGKTVLVTNSGTIAADGGTILLTARAADGIVTNLVSNTGRLRANSVGDKPGTIVVSAVGGSISIEGSIEANGRTATGVGGTVALTATDTVALGATARVSANGRAGGGTVAIGTSAERARNQGGGVPAGSARAVTVAAGARIAANGRGTGSGGSVAVLASDSTSMAGTITARGGKSGGDGGQVEVSSGNTFALTGRIDVGAAAGRPGNILIDPRDISITPAPPAGANDPDFVAGSGTINSTLNPTTDYTISDATISGFTGNVTLQASRDLFVSAGVTINLSAGSPPQALTLQAGNNLAVAGAAGPLAAASITASGSITLAASSTAVTGATATGTATIAGTLTSTTGLVRVISEGSAGVVNINAPVSGALIQVSGAAVNVTAGLTAAAGQSIALSANALTVSAPLATGSGTGVVAVAPLTAGTAITVEAGKNATAGLSLTPGDLALLAPVGAVARLNLGDVAVAPGGSVTAGSIAVNTAFAATAPTLGLYTTGGITQSGGLTVGTLTGIAGTAALNGGGNAISNLGPFSTTGSAAFASGGALNVSGAVSGTGVQVSAPSLTLSGSITAVAGGRVGFNTDALAISGGTVSAVGGTVAIAPFTPGTDLRVQGGSGTSGLFLDPGTFATLAPGSGGPALLVLGDTSATPSAATAQAANVVLQDGFTLNVPTLGLYAGGSVSQVSAFSVTNLTGGSGGDTTLAASGNGFAILGRYSAGGSASFRSDVGLTVGGPVTAGGALSLASPRSLTLNGALAGTAVGLRADAMTVNAGTAVTANSVAAAPISGGTALIIAAVKGSGGLFLTPTEIGRLSSAAAGAPTSLVLGNADPAPTVGTATAGSIAINAPLSVNAANFGLYTTGAVSQTGAVTAGTVFGGSGGNTVLTASNAVGALGGFAAGGSFSLTNGATLLSVTGPVAAGGGDVLLQSATGLALSGNLYSSGTVRLQSGGTVTQSGGIVAAGGGDLFVTGLAGDLAPTGGSISQTGSTLAASGRVRLYSGGDASFTGVGTVGGHDIEVIALGGANSFAEASGPNTGMASIATSPALGVTLTGRPATLRLDGTTIAIGRAVAADAVELHSKGNTTEPGGSITANTLTGTAGLGASVLPIALPSYIFPSTGSALLDNTTNAVGTVGTYTGSSGFTLDNGANTLTANAGVMVSTGALALRAATLVLDGSVSLSAPRIELAADAITNGPGQLHIPTTGALALSPYTAGPYTIGAAIGGETAISVAQIQSLLPSSGLFGNSIGTLQLGGTSAAPASVAAGTSPTVTPTDTLTINAALNLTGLAGTLALNGRSAVTETPGSAITVGTLSGASGGTFQLDASLSPAGPFYGRSFNNAITQLGSITAGGDVSVANGLSLATLSGGTVTAGAGTVTLSTRGALTLGGTLGAGGGVGGVTLNAVTGISQSVGGSIQTGTLSGFVGDANAAVVTGRNAVLTNTGNKIATLGNFSAAQGNLTLTDSQALTVAAGATVTGRDVLLSTNGAALAMVVNGAIGACATSANLNGVVTLSSSGTLTISGPGAIVGGERATILTGASNIVANGAFVEAGRSGTPAYDGTITAINGLMLQGGTVAAATVTSLNGITQSGGVLSAATLNPGAYTFSGGEVYSGTALTLSTGVVGAGAGDVISAPSLTVNAAAGYTSFGTIISPGSIQINLSGDFTQAAGQIYAGGNLTLSGVGNTPAPGLIAQSGGVLASANATELYAGAAGAVSIAGSLSGQVVQVLEPAATLTFAPATLAANAGAVTFPGYAVQFHCPGCETPAVLPSAVATTASLAVSGTTPLLRVDAGSLTLAAPVTANTVELHSVGNTVQTDGAPITTGAAGMLTGTAGYAATIPSSGLPSWDSPVTAGSAMLTNPLNNVPIAGPYYTGGSLALTSAVPNFTVRDLLVAGGGQSIALTNAQASGLLTIDGVNSGLLTFGSVRGGNFATNPHPNVRGVGVVTQSTVNPVVSPSQVVLTADQLSITAPGPSVRAVDARGGVVSIAPFSADRAVSVDASRVVGASVLSLGAADLGHINTLGTASDVGLLGPRTIRLGSTDGTLTHAAGSVTLNTNLALNNQAAVLALYAKGNISESPASSATHGSLSIGRTGIAGTLTGAAGGTVSLGSTADAAPANHFDVLGPFAAGNGLSVSDTADANAGRSGMLVQGTVSSGAGALGLLDVGLVLGGVRVGGTITVGSTGTPATLDATGQSLTLVAQNGPGGAAAVTEAVNSTVLAGTLTGRASTNDPVSPASLAYDVLLNGSVTNRIDTLGPFIVGTGPVTAVSAQGAFRLNDAAPLIINGPVVAKSVSINANGMTVAGDIGACIVGGGGGDVVLKSGLIAVLSGTVGGQASVSLDGGVLQTGGTVDAPIVGVTGGLTEAGGVLFGGTVSVAGGASVSSGVLHASTLNAATSYTGGDLYADSALTVSLAASFSGSIGSSTGLTINAGNLVSTGTLYSGGSLTLNVGEFSQTAGVIGAHGNLTILASGIATQAGGTMEAGGTLLVRAFGSAGSAAVLSGTIAAQTVQLVEPGYALSAVPVSLGGAYAVNVGPLVNVYHCPGCDTAIASSSAAILPPASPALRPLNLRLDGNTLALGTLAADNVELHSIGVTTQTGPLTALNLTGTAGYVGSPDQVPVYNPGTAQIRVAGATPDYTVVAPSPGATVSLLDPANNIFAVNGYQAAGGLALVDQPANQTGAAGAVRAASGLTLTGIVRAGPATDPLDATAEAMSGAAIGITTAGGAGALGVNGVVAGSSITLNASGPITETGTLVADTLTGSASSAALNTPNQVATLGAFTAPGGFGLVDARDLVVVGKVSATNGNATISAGTLTIAAPPAGADATVSAGNVTLRGVDVIVNGLVGACSIGDATTGNLSIAANGGSVVVNAGAILGGQTSATLAATGAVQVQGGIVNAPSLAIEGLALTSGLVFGDTVTLNRTAAITGGTLNAGTLNTPGGLQFAGGTLNAGSGVSLTAGPTLDGQVSSGGTLTINGGSIAATANLTAANVAINASGDFRQQSGLIATTGSTTIAAGGLITQAAPGQIEAGDTILLRASGTGPATIEGQLAAARIEVVEPGAALSFNPAPFSASDTHPLRGAATVTLGSVANSFDCPGCLPAALPVSTVTASSASPGANRPAFVRLDGGTIALGAAGSSAVLAADSVELHSLGATIQAGGSLETLSVGGTAGYAGSTAALPVYSVAGAQTRTAAGYGLAAAVANGTVALDSPGNNIAGIGTYQVRGDDPTRGGLVLVTTPVAQSNAAGVSVAPNGLVVSGTVRAGPSSDPLDASAAAATGNGVSLTVNGGGQDLRIASTGLVGGSTVAFTSSGGIAEVGGRIVAGTLTGSAGGDVTLATATSGAAAQGGNQVGTVGSFSTAGGFTLQNSRSLTVAGPINASSSVTITAQSGAGTASVAEGQAGGDLRLVGPVVSGGDATLTAYGDLTGVGPTVPGTVALNGGGEVRVSGISAGAITGNAGGSFDVSGSFGTASSTSAVNGRLTLSDTGPLLLGGSSRSQGGMVITAPGITSGGELDSAQSIQLHVTGGDFTQTGGTIAAASSLVISGASDTASVPGGIAQQAGLLAAGGSLRLLATADAIQGAGTIAAPAVQVVSIFGLNTFGASQSATVALPGAGVNLGGVLPGFTVPAATTTLSGRPATVRLDGTTVSLTRLTAADTVELHAATNLGELAGGRITANTLLGSAGYALGGVDAQGLPIYTISNAGAAGAGAAILPNANDILRLGPFDARSGLTLADVPAAGLTVTGLVRAGLPTSPQDVGSVGAPLNIAVGGPAGTLSLADGATLAGSQINLTALGAITEAPGALLLADTLSGSAASAALTPANGNQVGHLGPFSTDGALSLLNAGDLQVTGAVKAGPSLNLSSRGNLDIGGGSLAANTVALAATGTITETGGGITAGNLTATAAQITARSPGNQIATVGALSADGGIALSDAASLTVIGPVTASNGAVSLQSQGDLTAQSLISGRSIALNSGGTTTLGNTIRAGADLSVTAGGRLAFEGGSATAANTVTTQSGSATTLSGTLSAASAVSLGSSQSLTLAGAISSPLLTAGAPAITLQGGTITTGGSVQPSLVTAARLPDAPNRSGGASATSGAFFQAGNSFVETNTVISTLAGYPNTTVRVSLLSPSTAATVSLAALYAPSTNLILDLQNGSGRGAQIRVANFVVSYAGSGLSPGIGLLDLTGVTVGSQVGTGAASAGVALANPSRNYQINACAVGSVNCVVLRPQAVPVGNPLKELSLSFFNDQDDDRDLLVPNITDQGL